MIPSLIITLRETLEAALIVGIILSYLKRTSHQKLIKFVWYGTLTGIGASIIGAIIFNSISTGFTGRAEELFEGITMIIGALLLTTLIIWMLKHGGNLKKYFEGDAEYEINKSGRWGIFFLVTIAVLREGIETIIFLQAAGIASPDNNIIGAIIGIIAAIILGYLLYIVSLKLNLRKFFTVTSIILILFAAGLIAHGVHELQEAKVIPIAVEYVWDINPDINSDGSYPLLHEKGYIGSILKGLFGYNGNPNLLEVISYIFYIITVAFIWIKYGKQRSNYSTNK